MASTGKEGEHPKTEGPPLRNTSNMNKKQLVFGPRGQSPNVNSIEYLPDIGCELHWLSSFRKELLGPFPANW